MKATELMINDLVTVVVTESSYKTNQEKTSRRYARVTDISPNCCMSEYMKDDCTLGLNLFEELFDLGDFDYTIEPIPLTEEILKANGFELDTPCKMLYQPQEVNGIPNISGKYQYVEVTFRRDEIYKIEIYNSWNNVEYGVVLRSTVMVHELQHALRLCNLNDLADNFKLE